MHASAVCAALAEVGVTYSSTPEHAALTSDSNHHQGFNFKNYGGE